MSILLMSLVLVGISMYALDKITSFKNLNVKVNELNLAFLKLNNQAQSFIQEDFKAYDFLLENKSPGLQEYNQSHIRILNLIDDLQEVKEFDPAMLQILHQMKEEIQGYDTKFNELTTVIKERGFRDHGREGLLRDAIHKVEKSDFPYDKVSMLMLRRHEKDFFMRKDMKYLKKFNAVIADFKHQIASMTQPDAPDFERQQAEILGLANNYQDQFNHIVELERQIGLSDFDGLKGDMNEVYLRIEPQIDELNKLIKVKSKNLITQSIIFVIGLFLIQFVIGFILVLLYSKVFTRAIKEIKEAAVSLSNGSYPEKMEIRSRDELGETKKAFNNLIKRIRAAADFANRMGNGELEAKYNNKYSNDVLARSIISMQDKLLQADKEQKKVNWSNQGMVLFNEILKNDQASKEELADRILRQLVKYLGANQGAIFIVDEVDGKPCLARVASFAYGKKKYIDQKVEIGESLVGEAVLEKDTIYLTEIPQGYTHITSGLGEATPSNILIVPFKVQERVVGVVELAFFHVLEDYKVKFLEKLSEGIANLFSNKKLSEDTQQLLEESQQKAEMMAAQEEELRQNTEELRATQEDMRRKTHEMESEIDRLKMMLQGKEEENNELVKKLAFNHKASE